MQPMFSALSVALNNIIVVLNVLTITFEMSTNSVGVCRWNSKFSTSRF